jgi:hypothetical protein
MFRLMNDSISRGRHTRLRRPPRRLSLILAVSIVSAVAAPATILDAAVALPNCQVPNPPPACHGEKPVPRSVPKPAPVPDSPRNRNALSVMTLNLMNTDPKITDPDGKDRQVPWRTRYDRISELIAKKLPDIVTFQEVYIRQAWPLPSVHLDPADYETIFTIIAGINKRTPSQLSHSLWCHGSAYNVP